MITKKKGIELNQAFGAVLVVVLLAVLIIVAMVLFSTLNTSFVNVSQSIVNESVTANNDTNVTLGGASTCNFQSDVTGGAVLNASNALVITSGNYTIAANGNMILDSAEFNDTALVVSYTYTNGGDACNATQATITQFATYPALIGLVGTIIFLGLVIGVLVASFVFGGRKDQP